MKKIYFISFMLFFIVSLSICRPAKAFDWRLPLGLSYVSGFGDVVDIYEENLEAEGYIVVESGYNPVGISFHPYIQFDNGFRIGGSIGPFMVIFGDASHLEIPLNLNGGYTFIPSANTSPYIRAGIAYHVTTGDYVEASKPGLFGGIGIEFFRKKPVGFGIEIAYDTSEIEVEKKYRWNVSETENITTTGLMLSIYAIF